MTPWHLRAAEHLLTPAVASSLSALTLTGADLGAATLATGYARAIDAASGEDRAAVLRDLGPKLLAALIELGATPKARAAVKDGSAADDPNSTLARLREARRL